MSVPTYRYHGCDDFFRGCFGEASPATGHDDPESAEFGAWLFQPAGFDVALYCAPADLDLIG